MDSEFWQDAEHRVQRARDLLRRRQLPEALEELRAAAELEPANPIHHFELGRCLELVGRSEDAADSFARAAELDCGEPAYLHALGNQLLRLTRWREAIEAFSRLEKLDPEHEPSYTSRILAYAELGDHQRAEEMFYLSQQVAEDSSEAFYNVARSLAARGLHDRAIWCWKHVLELSSGGPGQQHLVTQCYLRLAESLTSKGELEQARRHYLQSLARNGRHVETLLGLAELLLRMRQFDAAGERITRAVRLDPDNPLGHFLAGRRFLAIGKIDEAAVALRRAAELDPTLPRVHLMLARVAVREEDVTSVRRQCRAEMLLRPEDTQTLLELASLLMDIGEFDNAAACLKRAVAIRPTCAKAWQNLGVAECWRGNLMQGVVASRRALKLDPANVAIANNLGLALLEMEEIDAAAKVVCDALEHDPRSRVLRRLRIRLGLKCLANRASVVLRRLFGRRDD